MNILRLQQNEVRGSKWSPWSGSPLVSMTIWKDNTHNVMHILARKLFNEPWDAQRHGEEIDSVTRPCQPPKRFLLIQHPWGSEDPVYKSLFNSPSKELRPLYPGQFGQHCQQRPRLCPLLSFRNQVSQKVRDAHYVPVSKERYYTIVCYAECVWGGIKGGHKRPKEWMCFIIAGPQCNW